MRSAADAYWRMRDAGVTPDEATLSAALAAGPPRDGATLDAAAAMALYRDARALDVRPNNEGFRRLTGMWVDQAFDGERAVVKDVSGDAIVAASDDDAETTRSSTRASASASSAPDFMLASLVDDDSRDVGGYGARRSVSRKNDRWIDDGDARRPLVDVHGLSTMETRAAVLSVLQALRERRRARLAVSGDLVIVTGSRRARKSKHLSAAGIEQRGSVLGGGVPSETSLRDAVKGLAKDLDLVVEDVEQNAGRLVIRERELLKWLDRDRAAARRGAAVPERAAERTAAERTAAERTAAPTTEKPRDDDDDDDDDAARTAASLPRRRRASRRRSRSRDVPGLEGALKEWLRENDSAGIDP